MPRLAIPMMGNYSVVFAAAVDALGVTPWFTTTSTRDILELGLKAAPDTTCLPFKIFTGYFVKAALEGCEYAVMVNSQGFCRLRYYCHMQKKILTGLFGGEGFIMQKLEGDGMVFVHAGGTVVKRKLQSGETVDVDTGCIVALEQSVRYDIRQAGNIKTALFGGEGLFFATLQGPGRVWLQSLPFSRLAGRMLQAAPQRGGSRGEGSLLGSIGGLLDGDNRF